ncbi:Uma2 family endonuclease [Methylopila sp. M107]|uniref:Uma2 family endonuclease n=1 Tax=Methylopila sp. M107 TaxID=1101190 RepID=UPI00039F9B87|nr:Uma2 family endonuclease [Methylopila sp. M107]
MNFPLMKPARLTVEEFRGLELNAPEEERWELIDGHIVRSMAGGTKIHNLIVFNARSALTAELRRRGSPCRAFSENVRLDIEARDASTLPDVVVSCSPFRDGPTTLRDAAAIIEVLSPSTALFDQEKKLSAYLQLPSLQTCCFVHQDRTHIAVYSRTADGWLRKDLTSGDDVIQFAGIDASIPVDAFYVDVAEARAALKSSA